ncbi:MAG: RNA methyltransferase [Clostridia bacterium]|nr:RNA methyltransferase [Clostridia bacterium]
MIRKIESLDNRIIKQCIKLQTKKYRDQEGRYLLEGPNLVEEAIKNGAKVEAILVKEDFNFDYQIPDIDIYFLGDRLFSKISLTDTPQGIMAIVKKQEPELDSFLKEGGNVLVLDKLQDPGNVGTMIRTADAAGYYGVILVKGSIDVYSPKVVRSAAGSLFRVPIMYVDDYEKLEEILETKTIVATGFNTDTYYYDVDLTKDIALVIGNEGNGVDERLMEKADQVVKIPMAGNIESLNAAVAAGILMYERNRNARKVK